MDDKDKVLDYTKPIRLPDDCNKVRKNFTQGYFYREIGHYNNAVPSEFQWAAEDKLINKAHFEELKCQLPDSPRSTFLMVFSPDGKKVASTHGNHNVYVTDLTTGKNIQTLSGHPRTPWCIAFHPSSNQILASGCLGGQVRVWDLQGRSEVWTTESQTVIASLAFHPVDRMLVIATYNELHFWDWSQPEPFAKCSTKSEREKVRYVSFDRLGNKLITGIANPVNVTTQWDRINVVNSQPSSSSTTSTASTTSFSSTPSTTISNTQSSSDQGRSITFCYRHLMNQYNQLVNRYLNLSRSRITPTTDRGTDPMDLFDLRNNGNTSEGSSTNPSPSTSNSQASSQPNTSSSPLRFKITGSGSRALNSRRKFQFLSSLNDRIHSQQSSGSSTSLALTTASGSCSTQHTTFTTPTSSSDSPSTSSSQPSSPRLRRCALSLGPTARSWCLTFTPENSSSLFSSRHTSQAGESSGAVTNPTYTSYSDSGIFSTRESGSSHSGGSQFSVVCPYRMLLDDMDDHRLTIHRAVQPSVSDASSSPSSREAVVNSDSFSHGDDFTTLRRVSEPGVRRNSDETGRDHQRSPGFNFRRYRNDSRNLRNLHEHQSQLRLITNRETHGLELQNNQNLRRQLSFRPGGQFVLSRHSNSPFQPRVPHHGNPPANDNNNGDTYSRNSAPETNLTSRPEIPSTRSSFAASSLLNSAGSTSSSSSSSSSNGTTNFSSSSTANNHYSAEGSYRQLRDQVKTRLFDRVGMMLRDRMRNSSEVPSVDSTVNYSQISGESEEINESSGLGPRGTDPMLSSASDNRDASNDGLFLRESPSSGPSNNASETGSGQQNESEVLDLWESETSPFSLTSNLPLNDLLEDHSSTNREPITERHTADTEEEAEPSSSSPLADNSNTSTAEYNMREGIQRLSLQIEGMQVLCRDRIEILQREKIRGMWENLTNQIRQFQNAIQTRNDSDGNNSQSAAINPTSDNSNSSSDLPSLRDLAISSSPLPEPNAPRPSTSSNYNNVINGYKQLLESMVNELFNEIKKSRKSNDEVGEPSDSRNNLEPGEPAAETAPVSDRNEAEEPQPGPSGVSTTPTTSQIIQTMKRNIDVKLLIETLKRERRRRVSRLTGGMGSQGNRTEPRSNNYLNLRHSSRDIRRNKRLPDYLTLNTRAIERRLHDILESRRDERGGRSSTVLVTNSSSQTSAVEVSNSSEACQSCGQKKSSVAESGSQKRRNTDAGGSESSSKILKNNTGERSRATGEEDRGDEATPSTSSAGSEASTSQGTSTNELLNQMIQTMVTMLRFLREAFARTEDRGDGGETSSGPRGSRQGQEERASGTLSSSGDDSDEEEESEDANPRSEELFHDLPGDFRRTKEIIGDLMRDVTQLRAKKLLGFTVKCLTQFFGKNFGNLIQVLDEQFLSLYKLLHLAMELTDLLLRQLNSRSRDLERSLDASDLNVRNAERRTWNLLLSRSNDLFSRRERFRSLGRNSHGHTFGPGREEASRSNTSRNLFVPSCLRLSGSRFHSPGSSGGPTYDRSSTFLSNYARRRRRRMARMLSTLPSGWTNPRVIGLSPPHLPSGSLGRDLNGHSVNNLRSFRFGRRTNEEQDSYSDIRAFNYEGNSRNSSRTRLGNDTNNNYDSNDLRTNDIGYYNGSNNSNSGGYRNNGNNSNNNNNNNSASGNHGDGSNFFNHYFQNNSSSNVDSSNNNIIIVTGLNSDNDGINSPGNNSRNTSTDGSGSGRSSGSSFINQNTLTPLRSMELTLSRNDGGDLSLRDERPIFWIRYGGGSESSSSSNGNDNQSRINTFTVPVVQVNDVPVSDVSMLNQPRHRPQSPVPRGPEDIWRWRAWRPRLLHPRNPFEDQDSSDVPENIHYYRLLSTSAGSHLGVYALDPIITDAHLSPRHRIQAWDFSKMNIPDISDREANGVVPECKIHNDASVDVSNDGHLLVTLLPAGRLSVTTMLGVYSLDWSSLGQLLYRTSFEQNAVSVSLSPTNRHLLVGLASRPVVVRERTNMAQIFRLEGGRPSPNGGSWQSGRGRLVHMRDLEQTRETNIMSVNCIRWAPGAGQGLVYGTNTGQLKVLR